ncbi:hypothetical protein ABPG72_013021 [Tetrahymena utriculariae]
MNSRSKGVLGVSSSLSSKGQEKSRTNMVSPTKNNQEKQSTSSNARQAELQLNNSQKMVVTSKNPSLSLKPSDKKQTANISLQPAKSPSAQISLNNINSLEPKKVQLNQPSESNQIIPEQSPLNQLDISGITPIDKPENQNSSSANQKNTFSFNIPGFTVTNLTNQATNNSTNNNASNNNTNLSINNGTASQLNQGQTLKKAVSINQPPQLLQTSQNYNQLQKSPSKNYSSMTPNLTNKSAPNGNLISSINLGTANQAQNATNNINTSTLYGFADAKSVAFNDINFPNQAMDQSVNFEVLKQFDQKQKQSNIKTFIRVRPLNKMEIEFNENGMGNENLRFNDNKTICVMPEKGLYTLDKVYPPDTQQEEIYEDVGRGMVNDVLQGYNGTIFAYGPTGSGKTYTMFGDVNDPKQKGIIPRVSNQIFNYINALDQDIEFSITVSMLEIYKEQLFDLLKVDRVNLKIKENPQKGGIYVQGLTAISVDCEEDILDAINLGYQSKQTRETRMNEYSSRSHTIFTITVTQRYSNGQEKLGKLNLVDLAGSEKLAKTQATGESLEEAKKINLSLSCLGNVIHALTSNQEHIPYRDSKLTRILQESLGGNYKTSLVAAISPHSSQHEEQISTLKFATRAKTIKNNVKMNVKLSVDQMRKLIEQLKAELEKAQKQNNHFKKIIKQLRDQLKYNQQSMLISVKEGRATPEQQQQAIQQNMKALEEILNSSELAENMEDAQTTKDGNLKINNSKSYEDSELDESQINNNGNNNILPSETTIEKQVQFSQFSGKRVGSTQKNIQNMAHLQQQQQQSSSLVKGPALNLDYKLAYQEKVSQCRNLEKEIMELKKIQLETERSLADVREEKHKLEYNHSQQITKNDYNKFEIEILHKQIQSLVDNICKQENSIGVLMKEKQEISQKKVEEFLKDKLNFSEIHFSEYFKNSINFNYDNLVQKWADVQKNMKQIGVDDQELFKSQAEFSVLEDERFKSATRESSNSKPADDQLRGSFIGELDFNKVCNTQDVLEQIVEFPSQLEQYSQKIPISRDLMIILLKKQLFNSHLINQHLARTINALEWKQIIEYGKAKMKSILNKIQTKHIQKLEQVINEANYNYKQLRNRIEQVELETQFVKEKINTYQEFAPKKSRIIKDTESIRNLLMKPSNDTIRKSLRGSFIGFQLDIEKTTDSPIMKELKEVDEVISKDLIPLTYDRAIEELKQRNTLIKRTYQELKGNFFNGINQEFIEQVLKEKERLEGKISILQNELKMETSKSEHYADAYKAEKQNFQLQKDQTKELEQFLVNKMKEETELMEKTQKKITDQHEKEILKYQQSFLRIYDKFGEFIKTCITKLSDMKAKPQNIAPNQIDSLYSEIMRIKDIYNKTFNQDGEINGNQSPQSVNVRFTPNSMIFKSFEGSIDTAYPFTPSNAIKIDDDNIKKQQIEQRSSIQLADETKDTNPNGNTKKVTSLGNTALSPSRSPQGLISKQSAQTITKNNNYIGPDQDQPPNTNLQQNATFSQYSNIQTHHKGTSAGSKISYTSTNYQTGLASPTYSNNTSNAINNSNKSKQNTNSSSTNTSKSNSYSSQGLFGYRKY